MTPLTIDQFLSPTACARLERMINERLYDYLEMNKVMSEFNVEVEKTEVRMIIWLD